MFSKSGQQSPTGPTRGLPVDKGGVWSEYGEMLQRAFSIYAPFYPYAIRLNYTLPLALVVRIAVRT
jgi:hypothetical protein